MIKRFATSTHGGIALATALLMPVLLGMAGLGIELGFWYTVKRSMQGAADAAVISAAMDYTASPATYVAHGKAVAAFNGWADGSEGVTVSVNNPPVYGKYICDCGAAIEVVISRPQPSFLAWAVGYGEDTTIRTHATALVQSGGVCILSRNASVANAVLLSNNANLADPNCPVTVNSSNAAALNLTNNAGISGPVAVRGGSGEPSRKSASQR